MVSLHSSNSSSLPYSTNKPKHLLIIQSVLLLFFSFLSIVTLPAAAVVDVGSWLPVSSATITKSDKVYDRRSAYGRAYYTDNQVSAGSDLESDMLRLVVTNNSYPVANADGETDGGLPYFDFNGTEQSIRIYFSITRASFNYELQLQQFIPEEEEDDADGDGIPDGEDVCPLDPDNDSDGDGFCAGDDICPLDPANDEDEDGLCANEDLCPLDSANDADGDGLCANEDVCPADPLNDGDADGICDSQDICLDDATNSCIVITGLVFGNGSAVDAAAVRVGRNTVNTSTDLSGEFTANVGNGELSSDGIDKFFPVKVTAEGFASGSTKVVLRSGKTSYQISVDLQQVSQVITEEDDVTQGVNINKDGAPVGSLTIPTNSLPSGVSSVTGEITYLDPESDDILSAPGGDLLALPEGADPNDGQVTLETFGMMEFDLVDQDGNEISDLAPGEMAEVCMRAPSGLNIGDTIPLWYYDEEDGLWKEEGQGIVENRDGELQICGEVGHFSWWNYDQPITTHSCMRYSIESESGDVDINGLSWYVEGVSYNGTSPSRSCSNDNGNTQFDSFTVKITTDTNNPEQIKVYTNIGGSKFYLLEDGDDTYSLTQSSANAAIFNTPDVQGSCLSNSQSGSCINLDHQTDNNGILPLSADVNLPPVIMEFNVSSGTLLPGETANVVATVTDPENSTVTLDWSVNCGYYGNNNGSEFMTPSSDSGASGQQFSAVMTAPDSLSYPIEYCEITLVATDDNSLFSTATRWIPVAASFEFQLNGVVYGTDGLPLANTVLNYFNGNCNDNGLQQSEFTDENGQYQFDIDLSSCIDLDGGFGDFGSIEIGYTYDNLSWSTLHSLNDYYYGGEFDQGYQSYCEVATDGATICDIDLHLPVLWGPVNGNVYLPDDIDQATASYFYINGNSFSNNTFVHNSLRESISLDLTTSPAVFGPIMVPVGDIHIGHSYWISGVWSYQTSNGYINSTDGTKVDLGNASITVPVVISVFDDNNQPLPNIAIDFTSHLWNGNSNEILLQGTTDGSGEYMADVYLGYLNGNSSNPFHYYYGYVSNANVTKYIDLGSRQECVVQGMLVDLFGVPIANESFYASSNYLWTPFTTDSNGMFSTNATPGYFYIEGDNYHSGFYYGDNEIDNCRDVAGQPRVVRFDAVMYEGFFGTDALQ